MQNDFMKLLLLTATSLMIQNSKGQEKNDHVRIRSFDSGWRFSRTSGIDAEMSDFNDAKWRLLDLPHDWSIEDIPDQVSSKTIGPFSKDSPGDAATGHTVGGTGWYRKAFTLHAADARKLVSVYFEGAYMETDVWVNGKPVGEHKYGYTSFYFDITKYCKPAGQVNIMAVRVVNKGKNSRWYSGSGLYRHVRLIVTDPLHIDQWGVSITTPKPSPQSATVRIRTKIINSTHSNVSAKIQTHILDAAGKRVAQTESTKSIPANGHIDVLQSVEVKTPKLWSLETPNLYRAEVTVIKNNKAKDAATTPFGIRSISITTENGLLLNGKKVELRGGCVHQDNGVLGSSTIDRAEEKRIELLKSNGFNAIRCSHNPPSEKFLETCDRLGMLVIDEAFDQWEKPKNPDDYHQFFDAWWEKDLSSMILRDRNHPSIILWSIGNEIEERADSSGLEIAKNLKAKARELDPTRLITEAFCEFWEHPGRPWDQTAPGFALLDVCGYNYQWGRYETDHKNFPNRIIVGTESVPQHAFQNWDQVEKHAYVIGDFVWTAMDYLGESGIGHSYCDTGKATLLEPWPWFNGYCGDIDLIGGKKPQSYYRDVVWRRSKIELAVHVPNASGCKEQVSYWGWPDEERSWTWPGNEGKIMQVNVYSRSPRVRLLLNGKIVDEKTPDSLLTAKFELPYAPGELKAVSVEDGKETANVVLSTAGSAKSLRLKADRQKINANRNDLSFVTVEVVDEKGNLVPNADIPVQFTIGGNGGLAGAGNANPADMMSFTQPKRNTFRGKCLVVLRPSGSAGKISLEARAEGLGSAEIAVETK
jgi:beta-galactosidase